MQVGPWSQREYSGQLCFLACEKGNEVKGDNRRLKRVRIRLWFLKLLKNGFYFLYTLRRNAGLIEVKHHFIALIQCCCPWSKLMT